MANENISGLLDSPPALPSGQLYTGRLVCDDVQITGRGTEAIATFTITVRQILDAANSLMLWTDQDVQRGIKPEVVKNVPKELPLNNGYPDSQVYVFNPESADEMAEKLLTGQKLFINPLVWNLRPGTFEAYHNEESRQLYIYDGKIYLPDSHHRHQAILKAAKLVKDSPKEYSKFNLDKQFKVELYFLKREDEGNYFFDKNQRPKPTAKSKAYDLTTLDDLSLLAKRVIDLTPSLQGNVNRVTDRLTPKNNQVVTLSTLREALKIATDFDAMDEVEIEGIAILASKFLGMLTAVRPELNIQDIPTRAQVRNRLLVDAPIMFQGYGSLIKDFNLSVSQLGMSEAVEYWTDKLGRISSQNVFRDGNWSGDFFSKQNPLWIRLGVLKPGLSDKLTVNNTRQARLQCAKALRSVMAGDTLNIDLVQIV